MPSYSDHNKFPIPSDGESGWATVMNTFLQITLEEALGGYTTQAVAGTNVSLTMANNATSVARHNFIKLTGTPGATRTITFPSIEKWWCVENSTDAAQTLTTSGGTTISLPAGKKIFIHCDGTNLYEAVTYSTHFATLAGGTYTGKIVGVAATTDTASFNAPHGTAPTSPVNGDLWSTSANLFFRQNGATKTIAYTDSNITGNAATATALATGRTIGMTGDVVWTSAAFDGTGNVTGTAQIQPDAVGATELATNAVTTAKINDLAVTTGKIADGAVTADKIGTGAVTAAKLADTAVSPGTYGSASLIPAITVDQQGRITGVTTNAVTSSTFTSGELAIGSPAQSSVLHGLGARPTKVWAMYRCVNVSGANGYSYLDEVSAGPIFGGSSAVDFGGVNYWTQGEDRIGYRVSSAPRIYATGGGTAIDISDGSNAANWKLILRAEL